jgi:uncharacterized membrane protein YcaP (DUF421 family)
MIATITNSLLTGVPVLEKVIRTAAVYLALVLLLRFVGRRTLAQLNPFDLVVLLLLSNVVQNAIIGPDNSLVGGLIGAFTLVALNEVLVWLSLRNKSVDRLLVGRGAPIITNGKVNERVIRRVGLEDEEVDDQIHIAGGDKPDDVKKMTLLPWGKFEVMLRHGSQGVTKSDIDRLDKKLERIEAALRPPQ